MSADPLPMDLNADLGESFGVYDYGADIAMLEIVSSANVACGFHGGDPVTMQRAVDRALANDVRIGAHVGLPDRLGFGRRSMQITEADAYAYTLYQAGALAAFVQARGAGLTHVKPHGALYMDACEDASLARGIVRAVCHLGDHLAVYSLPGSELEQAADRAGLEVYAEYFADRPYVDGEVQMFGWSLEDLGEPDDIAERVVAALRDATTPFRTVCVHSDTPGAPVIARAVQAALHRTTPVTARSHASH